MSFDYYPPEGPIEPSIPPRPDLEMDRPISELIAVVGVVSAAFRISETFNSRSISSYGHAGRAVAAASRTAPRLPYNTRIENGRTLWREE
jgi:hypothetical protein